MCKSELVTRYDAAKNIFIAEKKLTAIEVELALRVNGKPFRNILCSPDDLEDLAAGIIAQAEAKAAQIHSDARFDAKNILRLADKLLGELSVAHAKTNGVHSGALSDGKSLLLIREDVGRHNVFDKIHGAAIRNDIDLSDKLLVFSGRCSAEMVYKLARMNVPVVVAKSVPTTRAIDLAKNFGITLAGRLRADSFCVYTNPQRIVKEG